MDAATINRWVGKIPIINKMQNVLPILLRPVVSFCVRHSIRLGDVLETLKAVYIEVSRDRLRQAGEDVSASRLSVMTGVHRKDVSRLLSSDSISKARQSLAARIIGAWRNSKRFCNASGKPRVLSAEGKQSEFAQLVASVSADLNPYTVLFELERIGAVERSRGGLKLTSRLYVPKGDVVGGMSLLASDVDDLMLAVEENLIGERSAQTPNLHIKTEYDNIPAHFAGRIREWCLREGSAFHQRARNFLSQFDRDLSPQGQKGGETIRVAVGAFSHVQSVINGGKE